MTGAEALRAAIVRLRDAGIEDAPRDSRLLLAHAAGIASDRLTLHLSDDLAPDAAATLDRLLAARSRRQPVSQIIGRRLFWGRSFEVTSAVLDPRPETETLIAAALDGTFRRILDLGTGTGCILLTLLLERPNATGIGVDLSSQALAVAERNLRAFGLQDRTVLRPGNWFDGVAERFDLIVSNPPYIAADEMAALAPEVRDWEPHLALTPGADGLQAYRAITAGAAAHLLPGGRLLVEIGPSQGAAVADLMRGAGLTEVAVLSDMDGRDRVVTGRAAG
jgi:release factor glutamine methyltransferase